LQEGFRAKRNRFGSIALATPTNGVLSIKKLKLKIVREADFF
jgi:hypothetical protein